MADSTSPPTQQMVVKRTWWMLAAGLLLVALPAMVMLVVPNKAEAFLCFAPVGLVGVLMIVAGAITKQVAYADREGLAVAWEPFGFVTFDLKRSDISFLSVSRIERSFISINDFFVKKESVVIWGITATLRDGSERTVVSRVTPGFGKELADWMREATGIR